jgi:hypothetical protein
VSTKLIQLTDGTLVEVVTQIDDAREIAGGFAEKVEGSLENIRPLLIRVTSPVVAAWQEISKQIAIEKGEIELGFSFEGEGNLYIVKTKTEATLTVKLTLKPEPNP